MAIMFLLVHGSLLFLPPLEKIFPFFLILLKQNKNPVVRLTGRSLTAGFNGWYYYIREVSFFLLYFHQLEFT